MPKLEPIEHLRYQSTWRLLALGILTFGVYLAHYMKRQTHVLNTYLGDQDRLSERFVVLFVFLSYVSAALFIPYVLLDERHPVARVSDIVDRVWVVLMIYWGFMARRRINLTCNFAHGTPEWFSALWTFFFTPFYFNYKINSLAERVEQSDQSDRRR